MSQNQRTSSIYCNIPGTAASALGSRPSTSGRRPGVLPSISSTNSKTNRPARNPVFCVFEDYMKKNGYTSDNYDKLFMDIFTNPNENNRFLIYDFYTYMKAMDDEKKTLYSSFCSIKDILEARTEAITYYSTLMNEMKINAARAGPETLATMNTQTINSAKQRIKDSMQNWKLKHMAGQNSFPALLCIVKQYELPINESVENLLYIKNAIINAKTQLESCDQIIDFYNSKSYPCTQIREAFQHELLKWYIPDILKAVLSACKQISKYHELRRAPFKKADHVSSAYYQVPHVCTNYLVKKTQTKNNITLNNDQFPIEFIEEEVKEEVYQTIRIRSTKIDIPENIPIYERPRNFRLPQKYDHIVLGRYNLYYNSQTPEPIDVGDLVKLPVFCTGKDILIEDNAHLYVKLEEESNKLKIWNYETTNGTFIGSDVLAPEQLPPHSATKSRILTLTHLDKIFIGPPEFYVGSTLKTSDAIYTYYAPNPSEILVRYFAKPMKPTQVYELCKILERDPNTTHTDLITEIKSIVLGDDHNPRTHFINPMSLKAKGGARRKQKNNTKKSK